MDYVNEMLETMQATQDNAENESDQIVVEACTQFPELAKRTMSIFVSLSICTKILINKQSLLCHNVQAQVEINVEN